MQRLHPILVGRGTIGALLLVMGITLGRVSFTEGSKATSQPLQQPPSHSLEAMVYMPLADNSGHPFSEEVWQGALAQLITRFGGATLNPAQEGCWLDERGRVQREPIRPVVVSFAPDRLPEFRDAVKSVGQKLGQEAMYVRFQERRIELVSGKGP